MNENKDKGKPRYEITEQGSLGLLAYGDIGIRAWRKVRDIDKSNILDEE